MDPWSAKLIPCTGRSVSDLEGSSLPCVPLSGIPEPQFLRLYAFYLSGQSGQREARSAVCATWLQRPEQTHRAIARGVATLTHLLPKSVKEVPVGAQDDHLPNISARQCPPEQPWPKAGTACPVSSLAPRSKSCGEQGSGPTGAPWAWMAAPSQLHFLCPGLHPQARLA